MILLNKKLKTMRKKSLQISEEIRKVVDIKNIKTGFGHDLMGMYCDIYINKKKIGYFNDDGRGGGADISMTQESRKQILDLLEKHQWRYKMFTELGWNFYQNESEINDDSVIESLIEHLHDLKEEEKEIKKISKYSVKEICYGNWYSYKRICFKHPLQKIIDVKGMEWMQNFIDSEIKTKMKEGEKILNTNFEELGLRK